MTKFGVAYFGNRFLSHAKQDLKSIASCCDYIVHTVSETDLRYHKVALGHIFEESRKLGLEVWADPWGVGGIFGGESFSKFLLDHRDSWQIMSDGRPVPSVCLNRPEWKSFIREWILNVRDLGAQVAFWDEPHVAFNISEEMDGIYSCVCPVCRDLFKKSFGEDMPTKLNEHARQFRRDSIRNFLIDVMAYAKHQGLKNAVCLYAFKGNKEYDFLWDQAGELQDMSIFGCDPYWRWHGKHDPKMYLSEFSKKVLDTAKKNGKESQIWIQAMRFPSGAEQEIETAVQTAVESGITHIAAWSFDGGELLDPVLSERPLVVWEAVQKAFRMFRK